MKTLYLIRHGAAEHNALFQNLGKRIFYDKRYYDTKLIGEGKDQALLLNKTWKEKGNIELVLCSSLTRTLETAELIFKDTKIGIVKLWVCLVHKKIDLNLFVKEVNIFYPPWKIHTLLNLTQGPPFVNPGMEYCRDI